MNLDGVQSVLAEFDRLRSSDVEPELEALTLALLLEDAFDVVLTEDDLAVLVRPDPDVVEALLRERRRG